MRMLHTRFMSVAGYLAFVAGLGALCLHLSHHLGTHVLAVAAPYLLVAKAERPMSLVERRRADAAIVAVADAAPAAATADAYVLEAPSIPAGDLAAQMDIAEGLDVIAARTVERRVGRARTARPHRVAAADVFGRSFGVIGANALLPSAQTGIPMLRWAPASYQASAAAAVAVSASDPDPSPSSQSRASSSGDVTRLGTAVYASWSVVWLESASTQSATISVSPSRRVNVPSAGVP